MSPPKAPAKNKSITAAGRAEELDNARLGVVFFLSTLTVLEPESTLTEMHKTVADFVKSKAGGRFAPEMELIGKGAAAIDGTVNSIAAAIKKWLCERFKISEIDAEVAAQHLRKNLPGLIASIKKIVEDEGKSLGGLGDVAGGLYKAITKTVEHFSLRHKAEGVVMESGHPDLIASSIRSSVARSALIGLAEAALAGAKMLLAAFTAGVGEIINKIAGVIEAILRFAVRFCEARTLARLFDKAKQHWMQKHQPDAIHKSPGEFVAWFKRAIDQSPIVASLVMNCGIAGDALRFLQVCTVDRGSVTITITKSQYDTGVTYLNALKSSASGFIREYQEQVPITSKDKMCASLLAHAGDIGLVQKEAASAWRAQLFAWSNSGGKAGSVLGWAMRKAGLQSKAFGR
ncbi:MAG TPA: hypothetical protein VJ011_02220 [Steroidobacteraceae bacterium]|nr:hypothetical protein [Steroidobacteraceae bacterium]